MRSFQVLERPLSLPCLELYIFNEFFLFVQENEVFEFGLVVVAVVL